MLQHLACLNEDIAFARAGNYSVEVGFSYSDFYINVYLSEFFGSYIFLGQSLLLSTTVPNDITVWLLQLISLLLPHDKPILQEKLFMIITFTKHYKLIKWNPQSYCLWHIV